MSDSRCTFLTVGRRGEECGQLAKWEYPAQPSEVGTRPIYRCTEHKPPQVDHTAWRWIGAAK